MVLQVETKNVTFGSIIDGRIKQHHLPVLKHSSLKVVFWAFPSFAHFKDFDISSEVFELMTSALAYIKCQIIFYNTAKDETWYSGSFGILSFYFPPLELVHRVAYIFPCDLPTFLLHNYFTITAIISGSWLLLSPATSSIHFLPLTNMFFKDASQLFQTAHWQSQPRQILIHPLEPRDDIHR